MYIVTRGMKLRSVWSLGILTEFIDIASLCFAKWKEMNLNHTQRTAFFNRILFIQNVNTTWLPLITHPSKGKDINQQCSWSCQKKYNCKYLGHQNTWIGETRAYWYKESINSLQVRMSSDMTILTQKEMFRGVCRSQQSSLRFASLCCELFVQLKVLALMSTTKDLTVQQER